MTAIIGVAKNGKVWVGGDSAAACEDMSYSVLNKKVFTKHGMVFGYAGSFRYGQALQYLMPEVKAPGVRDPLDFLIKAFVPVFRDVLDGLGGVGSGEDEEDTAGDCLVGLRGRLFIVQSNFSVLEPASGIAALGHAEGVTMGAALALAGRRPEFMINRALSITAGLTGAVLPPFTIESV